MYLCTIEDDMIMEVEDIVEVEYCMSKLVDLALGQTIEPPRFNLNVDPLRSLDVGERPPPIVKVEYAQHHAQLLHTFFMDNVGQFNLVMKLQAIYEKLNKIFFC